MPIVWLRLEDQKTSTGFNTSILSIAIVPVSVADDLDWMTCSMFEAELADVIPVVKTSIAGTRIIGRLCAGKC